MEEDVGVYIQLLIIVITAKPVPCQAVRGPEPYSFVGREDRIPIVPFSKKTQIAYIWTEFLIIEKGIQLEILYNPLQGIAYMYILIYLCCGEGVIQACEDFILPDVLAAFHNSEKRL